MNQIYVKIDGIHCEHCESKITNALLKNSNIKEVIFHKNIAYISYEGELNHCDLIKTINDLDYITKEEYISDDLKKLNTNIKLKEFIVIFICIILLAIAFEKIFRFHIFNMIPTIDSNITYGMLVVTGILTSIHCISMCGAINLMAVVSHTSQKRNFQKPILYNVGRVLSYTFIGAVAGLVGSVVSMNETISGIIIMFAAIIMLFMALNMLGIVKFQLPKLHIKFQKRSNNAFVIGILNGFMPCGPLQAMQIYALSTGNLFAGAISMFLFGIGTVPLMLSVGIAINLVKGKGKILINKVASVLILILSIVMLNRGLLSLNIDVLKIFNHYDSFMKASFIGDYQQVELTLDYNDYADIIVQKDIPVKMIITVDENHLTGCNNEIILKDFGIQQKLEVGENVIEFTPIETGVFTYTCWMNMIKNNIKVIDDISYFEEVKDE